MARGAARPEVIFNDPRLHELVAITVRREDDIQTCTKGKIKLVLLALCCAVVLFHVTYSLRSFDGHLNNLGSPVMLSV
jgi:hypothetical protein